MGIISGGKAVETRKMPFSPRWRAKENTYVRISLIGYSGYGNSTVHTPFPGADLVEAYHRVYDKKTNRLLSTNKCLFNTHSGIFTVNDEWNLLNDDTSTFRFHTTGGIASFSQITFELDGWRTATLTRVGQDACTMQDIPLRWYGTNQGFSMVQTFSTSLQFVGLLGVPSTYNYLVYCYGTGIDWTDNNGGLQRPMEDYWKSVYDQAEINGSAGDKFGQRGETISGVNYYFITHDGKDVLGPCKNITYRSQAFVLDSARASGNWFNRCLVVYEDFDNPNSRIAHTINAGASWKIYDLPYKIVDCSGDPIIEPSV